jgi:hypothetical protein
MKPERYGWKVTLKFSEPNSPFPCEFEHTVQIVPAPTEADAVAAATEALKRIWVKASDVESVSVAPIWHPDYRKHASGRWETRDRHEVRAGRDPWFVVGGKPAFTLKSVGRSAGWTYYIAKDA